MDNQNAVADPAQPPRTEGSSAVGEEIAKIEETDKPIPGDDKPGKHTSATHDSDGRSGGTAVGSEV